MIPEYTHQLKTYMKDLLQDVHTILPGEIVSYDPELQSATIKPFGKFYKPGGQKMDYPLIHEVPVFFCQAMNQSISIVYRIEPGDACILLFAEQTLDIWANDNAVSDTDLRFDLSNAVAMVGLFARPALHAKRAYDNGSIIIQRENGYIEIRDKLIEIETDGDIEVRAAKNMRVNIDGNMDMTVGGNTDAVVGGNANIRVRGTLTQRAAVIHLNP